MLTKELKHTQIAMFHIHNLQSSFDSKFTSPIIIIISSISTINISNIIIIIIIIIIIAKDEETAQP